MKKKGIWIFIGIVFSIIWIFYLMFIYRGGFGMGYEVPGNKLTKTYLEVGDYKIGKQKWFYNICNKDKGCLDGEILGFKENIDGKYLYVKINYSTFGYEDSNGVFSIEGYNLKLFKGSDAINEITVNDINDLPKYLYLSNNNLEFFSENELKNLPQEQQNIFKELEKNPTVIINGVDYTK